MKSIKWRIFDYQQKLKKYEEALAARSSCWSCNPMCQKCEVESKLVSLRLHIMETAKQALVDKVVNDY